MNIDGRGDERDSGAPGAKPTNLSGVLDEMV
jgi:hypothetical protein